MKLLRALPLLCLLLVAPVAEAQKPIPGIQQTSQWKSMKNYVAFLESRESTPVTPEQKTIYTNTLASRQMAANNRVKQLYGQALNRIRNRDQRAEKKQIGKIRAAEQQKLADIRNRRSAKLAAEKSRFNKQTRGIAARFDRQKSSWQRQLQQLRRNLRRTNNPFRRQVILARIDTVTENLQTVDRQEKIQMQKAKRAHRQKADSIRNRFQKQSLQAQAYYQSLVGEVQNAWKKIYRDDVQAARTNRQRQFGLVSSLRAEGNQYIANMPPAT